MATQVKAADKPWQGLTPEEKLQRRLEAWLSPPGIRFASLEAKAAYEERVTNMIDAMRLKKTPARVPIVPALGAFAEAHCGYSFKEVMYDVDKAIDMVNRCTLEFRIDTKVASNVPIGRAIDAVDFRVWIWPGHGLPDDADGQQYVVRQDGQEDMKEDEYDALIRDPNGFWNHVYLPRVMNTLEPLRKLPYPSCGTGALAGVPASMAGFGLPEVQTALERMMEAGREILAWQKKMREANRKLTEMGFPSMAGGNAGNPFDLIGGSMRGARGISMDMFRQPEKLLEALEVLAPIHIQRGIETAVLGECPFVGVGTFHGADGFMSEEHFMKFYWPSYRKICLALIEEGLIPRLAGQGSWNSRLEIMGRDLPRGKFVLACAETDMHRAKEILGGVACLIGGVHTALLHTGTPDGITAHCQKLIETAGKDGGYMLSTSAGINRNTKAENVWAMINAARKYGVYS